MRSRNKSSNKATGSNNAAGESTASGATPAPMVWIQQIALWIGRILTLALLLVCPWPYGMVTWEMQTWVVLWVAAILLCAMVARPSARVVNWFSGSMLLLLFAALVQTWVLPDGVWQSLSAGAEFERRISAQADRYESTLPSSPQSDSAASSGASNATSDEVASGEAENGSSTTSPSPSPSQSSPNQSSSSTLQPSQSATWATESPRTLSIHPTQTRASATGFAAGIAMLLAAGTLFRGQLGNVLLLSTIALTGLTNALLGIFQGVVWNGWTLLEMPTTLYFATFVSRNSAPQYFAIAMGAAIGLLIWWSKSKNSGSEEKRYHLRYPAANMLARLRRRMEGLLLELDVLALVLLFAITLLFVATIAAASRGGILACLFAIIATLALTLGKKTAFLQVGSLIAIVGFSAVMLLSSLELDQLAMDRLDSISEEAYKLENGRVTVWQFALSEPAYWLTGCGLGNFHFAILPCYSGGAAVWFYHAENIYVELFTELGLPGLLIGLLGLGWLVLRLFKIAGKPRRNELLFGSTVFALSAVAIQSLVDFSLIIPAIFLPLAALVGCFLTDGGNSYRLKPKKSHHEIGGAKSRQQASKEHSSRSRKRRRGGDKHSSEGEAAASTVARQSVSLVSSCLAYTLVFVAMWQGFDSLQGFAFGDSIQNQVEALNAGVSGDSRGGRDLLADDAALDLEQGFEKRGGGLVTSLFGSPDAVLEDRYRAHPEVLLQRGRQAQSKFEIGLRDAEFWPEGTTDRLKQQFSVPETVAAALRGQSDGYLSELAELLKDKPEFEQQLANSEAPLLLAAAACPLDWRASWGAIRGDTGQVSNRIRALNYARLSFVTKHHPQLQETIGTTALWAGEKAIGLDFWRLLLADNPTRLQRVTPLVGEILDAEDLNFILPTDTQVRIRVAENLSKSRESDRKEIGQSLAAEISLTDASNEAQTAEDWLAVTWLAESRSDRPAAIKSLEEAARLAPLKHEIRFRLAKLYQASGKLNEAIEEMDKAVRRGRLTPGYQEYLELLQSELAETQ